MKINSRKLHEYLYFTSDEFAWTLFLDGFSFLMYSYFYYDDCFYAGIVRLICLLCLFYYFTRDGYLTRCDDLEFVEG